MLRSDPKLAVSDATRTRVWAAAQSLGYLDPKNPKRQGPSRQRVGLVLAPVIATQHVSYYTILLESVQSALANAGYQLAFVLYRADIDDPSVLYAQLSAQTVDGVITLGTPTQLLLDWVGEQALKLVLITSSSYTDDHYDRVAVDHIRSAGKAVDHLLERGCRRIAYLGPVGDTLRYQGFVQALARAGLPLPPERIWASDWNVESGCSVATERLAQMHDAPPDGLFAASDPLAIGALRSIQRSGLRVPEDIRLIGHDDEPLGAYLSPALSTVRVPVQEMGKAAVRLLAERLGGVRDFPAHVFLPTRVIVRESSEAAPPNDLALSAAAPDPAAERPDR